MLSITDQFIKVKSSAYDEIISELKDEFHPGLKPVPEPYFKLGKLLSIDRDEHVINIKIDKRLPVANTGDGVSVNTKAAEVLHDYYGMNTPGKINFLNNFSI